MLRLRCRRRRRAGAVGGGGTTRFALAARLRLGSIRADRVRIGRGGNGSRRPLRTRPSPPVERDRQQNFAGGTLAVLAVLRPGSAASLEVVGMARNVEVKARVSDLAIVEARARSIADRVPFDLTQDDTFFACPRGRLKLRELSPEQGELIFYRRPDVPGPKISEFFIAATPSPQAT